MNDRLQQRDDLAHATHDSEYVSIERDIQEERYDTLREKLQFILGERVAGHVDAGPADRTREQQSFMYSSLVRLGILPADRSSDYTRWRKEDRKSWPFDRDAARRLLGHLWKESFWSVAEWSRRREDEQGDNYFEVLVRQMECERTTEENLGRDALGVYEVWRPSVILPGRYVRGLFAVYKVEGGRPIKTVEIHRLRVRLAKDAQFSDNPEMEAIYLGYMVKKSRQILIHSFESKTRAFHQTVLTSVHFGTRAQGHGFAVMSGVTTGMIGHQSFYAFPIVLVRNVEASRRLAERLKHKVAAGTAAGQAPTAHAVADAERRVLEVLEQLPQYGDLDIVDQVPDFVRAQLDAAIPRVI
ncbi:MAG: hypothetical protein RLZZ584_3207 [Pseudomonadota bacterium]